MRDRAANRRVARKMDLPDLPWSGGCRCGRLRFQITATPLFTAICHCHGCQRMTGGAFSTSLSVPEDGFAVVAGEPVIGGLHGAEVRHHHCPHCLSWVFTRVPPGMNFVNVRATMLDDATWFAPFIETYTSHALPWALADAPHAYPQFPDPADYLALLTEFAAR